MASNRGKGVRSVNRVVNAFLSEMQEDYGIEAIAVIWTYTGRGGSTMTADATRGNEHAIRGMAAYWSDLMEAKWQLVKNEEVDDDDDDEGEDDGEEADGDDGDAEAEVDG